MLVEAVQCAAGYFQLVQKALFGECMAASCETRMKKQKLEYKVSWKQTSKTELSSAR